jgi:integrase
MMSMTRRRLESYRTHMVRTLTAGTANHNMKVLRMIFRRARLDSVTFTDPAEGVDLVKVPKKERRRPFTRDELGAILKAAEGEWRGLVLFGLYTGQRLGDLARLTWGNIDLAGDHGRGVLRLVTGKTHRSQSIPLHSALREYLLELNAGTHPSTALFPRAAAAVAAAGGKTGTLSNQFANVLAAAGLREKASHLSTREGRAQVLARVYGVAVLTLQRWIAVGDAAGDTCPVAHPVALVSWWARVKKRPPSAGILAAASRYPAGVPDVPSEVIGRGGAGMKKEVVRVSFHSLRHTATSMLKAAGIAASVVMDLIGHDDAAMSQHYTHTGDTERRLAVDCLPAL